MVRLRRLAAIVSTLLIRRVHSPLVVLGMLSIWLSLAVAAAEAVPTEVEVALVVF